MDPARRVRSKAISFDLQACLSGDKRAWDAFVERFAPVLLAAVRKTLGPRGDEESHDVLQDVFVRLLRDDRRLLRAYDPARASLPTYLTLVARSVALDHLRGRRPPMAPLEAVPDEPPAPPPAEDGPVDLPAEVLTPRQRLVLRLLFDHDMGVDEVAVALGVDPQTVRSTKHKAILALRKHFGGR